MMMVCLMAFCMLSYHIIRSSRLIVDCRRKTAAHPRLSTQTLADSQNLSVPQSLLLCTAQQGIIRVGHQGASSSERTEKGLLGRIRPSADSVLWSAASEPIRLDCKSLSSRSVARFLESESADACSQKTILYQHVSSGHESSLGAAQRPLCCRSVRFRPWRGIFALCSS